MHPPGESPRSPPHLGTSLAEVIVVLAVLGVAAAAVGRIGVGQQAHYRDFAERTRTRSGLREGSAVLAAELRGISPAAGDIYPTEMKDASIAFRSTVGAFVLCGAATAGVASLDVFDQDARSATDAPDGPSPGDSLWLYDSGVDPGGADDRWRPYLVTAVAHLRLTCLGNEAPATDAFRLTLSPAIQAVTEPHAPVRLFRRVRYALYQSSDGLWYLGFTDCRPVVRTPACASLQPVSGPYRPVSAANGGAASGLVLSYFDRFGIPTKDPLAVTHIRLTFRAQASEGTRLAWGATESQTIALRNSGR